MKHVAMPFGAGPRLCPCRYLAMLEMQMVMAMLFAHFDIQSVTTPDGRDAREELYARRASAVAGKKRRFVEDSYPEEF